MHQTPNAYNLFEYSLHAGRASTSDFYLVNTHKCAFKILRRQRESSQFLQVSLHSEPLRERNREIATLIGSEH